MKLKSIKRVTVMLLRLVAIPIVFLLFVVSLFYLPTSIYNFPEAKPFSGKYIFNPYEDIPEQAYRAHFHAHTVEWKGITDGHNSEEEVFHAYRERGYDVPGISNYHKISRYGETQECIYIPMYEHGYNVLKSHYLSINPDGVSFFDFPLLQSSSHQQKIIDNLREQNAYVAMAHPKFGGGRSMKNMRELTGYHFTEVLNHYRNSAEYYDEALGAGRLTWVMSNDDTHNLSKEPSFKRWNMIFADTSTADAILEAYAVGKNYAVLSEDESFDKQFISCEAIGGERYRVIFSAPFDSILVIGEGGIVKELATHSDTMLFTFQPSDSYLRVVAKDDNMQIYLNPLVRYNGIEIPLNAKLKAEENTLLTWLFRLGIFIISLLLSLAVRKLIIR